jgi:Ca2+/Na+ antiporter
MLAADFPHPQAMLIAGVAMLYIAGRAAVESLARDASAPGRRAVALWAPIAVVTIMAVFRGSADVTLEIVFATSVAAIALVGGCIAILGSAPNEPFTWPARTRKTAGLLLPATILTFMAGFSGHIGWLNSLLLLGEGVLIGWVWLDPADRAADSRLRISMLRLIPAILLVLPGAWAAINGTMGLQLNLAFPPPAVVVTTALSPLLVAPMLLSGAGLAQRGHAWAAVGTQIAVAQLNLCLLLPVAALIWRLRWGAPISFPIGNWRVDAVVLILLSAALLPAVAGRWRPRRLDGSVLLMLYVGYVLASIAVTLGS